MRTKAETYDAAVIGSGEAGKYLAWHLARERRRVVVMERSMVGGACPNIACLPSKNLLHSAKVIDQMRHADRFGARISSWSVDVDAIRHRKEEMVQGLIAMHHDKYRASGARLVMGEASFTGKRSLTVRLMEGGETSIEAELIFLNTGSRAAIPEIPGLAAASPMTHIQALEMRSIPEHLIVLGGGYVGLELAQAYRRFGSEVTLVQRNPRLLPDEDEEVSAALVAQLQEEGVRVILDAHTTQVEGVSGEFVTVRGVGGDGAYAITGTAILVATGRKANTEALNLAAAGVKLDANGFIVVNEFLETSAPGIWAMGDCAGSPMFTHVSYDDFRVVRDNLKGNKKSTCGRLIPFTLFTDPELARVGLSETEAKRQGVSYRIAKLPMSAVLRTRTLGETKGFIKALIGDDDQILGFTGFGVGAGEMAATVQVAMLGRLPYTVLSEAIITHPTLAEGLMYLFSAVPNR